MLLHKLSPFIIINDIINLIWLSTLRAEGEEDSENISENFKHIFIVL